MTEPSCGATAAGRSATTRRVVIVHSLVSRSYILDLRPGSSTVEYLVKRALTSTCWTGGAGRARRGQRLRDDVDEYLPPAVEAVP